MTKKTPTAQPMQDGQTTGRDIARALLRDVLGFSECSPESIDALVAACRICALGKGETLVRRGDPFTGLFIVLEGSVEACVLQRDGRRQLSAYLGPGDLAGITSLWDGLSHSHDLFARTALTRVMLVPGHEFVRLRESYPCLARALELQMAYRSRLMHERVAGDTSLPLDMRLARLLHILMHLNGTRLAQGERQLKISQADIGDFLGVSRQRANFAVQVLKRAGLVDFRYSVVTITDPQGLAQHGGL